MSTYGTVTDYKTGFSIREATPHEWRTTASRVNSGASDGYTGTFIDDDPDEEGRIVYVSGGPDTDITDDDIRTLAAEAGTAGDTTMAEYCELALDGDSDARGVCVGVILDTRMRAAEDAEESRS